MLINQQDVVLSEHILVAEIPLPITASMAKSTGHGPYAGVRI